MRIQGSGLRVEGSGFRVQGSGFRVQGSGFRVRGSGFRVQGSEFRVRGLEFRVQGLGFRVQGFELLVLGVMFDQPLALKGPYQPTNHGGRGGYSRRPFLCPGGGPCASPRAGAHLRPCVASRKLETVSHLQTAQQRLGLAHYVRGILTAHKLVQ